MPKFFEMTEEQRKEAFEKWNVKRMQKAVDSPAKRGALKTLQTEHKEEWDTLLKNETAKAKVKDLTPEQIEEKVKKFRENLAKKGPKTAGKRAAIKALTVKYKEEYEALKESELAKVRAAAKPVTSNKRR